MMCGVPFLAGTRWTMSMSTANTGQFALLPIFCTTWRQSSPIRTGRPLISTLIEHRYYLRSLRRFASCLFSVFKGLFFFLHQIGISPFTPSQIWFSSFMLSRISSISARNASNIFASSALLGMFAGSHNQHRAAMVATYAYAPCSTAYIINSKKVHKKNIKEFTLVFHSILFKHNYTQNWNGKTIN